MQQEDNPSKNIRKTRTSLDEESEAIEIRAKKDKRKKNYKRGQNPSLKSENDVRKKIRCDDA